MVCSVNVEQRLSCDIMFGYKTPQIQLIKYMKDDCNVLK